MAVTAVRATSACIGEPLSRKNFYRLLLNEALSNVVCIITDLSTQTSDTDMSVFSVLTGEKDKVKMNFALKNGQKKPDIVVSGRNF